jgi:hypothetical protein
LAHTVSMSKNDLERVLSGMRTEPAKERVNPEQGEMEWKERDSHDINCCEDAPNAARRFMLSKTAASRSFPGHLMPCQSAEDELVMSRRSSEIWRHRNNSNEFEMPAPSKFGQRASFPGKIMRCQSTNDMSPKARRTRSAETAESSSKVSCHLVVQTKCVLIFMMPFIWLLCRGRTSLLYGNRSCPIRIR